MYADARPERTSNSDKKPNVRGQDASLREREYKAGADRGGQAQLESGMERGRSRNRTGAADVSLEINNRSINSNNNKGASSNDSHGRHGKAQTSSSGKTQQDIAASVKDVRAEEVERMLLSLQSHLSEVVHIYKSLRQVSASRGEPLGGQIDREATELVANTKRGLRSLQVAMADKVMLCVCVCVYVCMCV
jgi:hypothetical protein